MTMNAPQQPTPEATPSPQVERVPRQPPKNSSDLLVDAALDALADGGLAPDNDNGSAVEKPPSKTSRREAPEPVDEDEEALAPEPEDQGEDGEIQGDEEQETQHQGRGSKEEPFTVKDLPADKFIEVKVDGEKTVVPLSELASGYIREQTFNKRINQTKALADQAEQQLSRAREFQSRLTTEFKTFVSDPDQIYDFFLATDEREQVFEAAARKYAELRRHHRENPEQRLAFQRQRDQLRLQQEREHFEQQRRAEMETRQRQEAQQRAVAIFKPGWEAGLRKAGFPQPTKELYEEVMVRANQRVASGQPVTSDDIADFTYRAAKLLELQPASAKKPKAAPPPPAKEKRAAARSEWEKVPPHKRRQNADFFLSSLKPKDYR